MKAFRSYFTPSAAAAERESRRDKQGEKASVQSSRGPSSSPATYDGNTITPRSVTPSPMPGSSITVPGAAHHGPQRRNGQSTPSTAGSTKRSTNGSYSFRHSIFPAGDARNSDSDALTEIRTNMMVNSLFEQMCRKQYSTGVDPYEGVVLKKARGSFTCCPRQMAAIPNSLYAMVTQMNVRCAMTINTHVVRTILLGISRRGDVDFVPLPDGLRIQILRTMSDLPKGQLHQFAAFIEDDKLLVIWADEPEKILERAEDLEKKLIELIWSNNADADDDDEKGNTTVMVDEVDGGTLEQAGDNRPVRLESACIVAFTMALCFTCLGIGWKALVYEATVDGSYIRFALLAVSPIQFFVSLFFFQTLAGNLFQIFGPISCIDANSKYYSGRPPQRLDRHQHRLPHVTFQMPVYKEGLAAVIKPTVVSVKQAISTYEMQGGTANIFVNDDGMQLISEEEAQARRDFYDEHNIGWVARPPHNPKPNLEAGETLFLRRGKFKKASNMNYALHTSNRVEDKLSQIDRTGIWTNDHETAAYQQCLNEVLREDEGRTWAEGNVRVGDYILLIDSDTRVPSDCLLDAVSEMEQSPEVAILQFASGVMNVSDSFFEGGVTWFTNLIYTAITYAVACGDACPFVGHNAMLRWQALQDAACFEEDGYEKYWSESHVSEDFDMALRLQCAGYSLRYASYTGEGFKEGVSLTVYDELARWEKYAYGCNELLFHPLRFWVVRGPFTPLFRKFLGSSIALPKKLTICAYIGTYYAIGAAWSLSLMNYFLTGWYEGFYDKYYLDSFAIYCSIIVVFTALGNLSLAILRYRTNKQTLIGGLIDNLKWIPMFTIFLGGISIHITQAILCHFFEIDMVWGATAKEVEEVHFGQEIVRILKRFKFTFLYCFLMTGLIVAGWFFFPHPWKIQKLYSVYPLASMAVTHFALPVLLNPALMMFTW
ncbi:glycosyl transferase family group 2-domain-containing protein [Sordaria brevicollis]|uniref:Glycosyl transferase family group 2-domain-containing protein n=1 Tax=Sordaria brevicollis TaxID=83679 RepID=A0AAE0P2E8_SORBR|nr:glycosyl transferase family group 2-domain-containing protein [Sordaria brevicollis]